MKRIEFSKIVINLENEIENNKRDLGPQIICWPFHKLSDTQCCSMAMPDPIPHRLIGTAFRLALGSSNLALLKFSIIYMDDTSSRIIGHGIQSRRSIGQ